MPPMHPVMEIVIAARTIAIFGEFIWSHLLWDWAGFA
jgi:hypothetical protein